MFEFPNSREDWKDQTDFALSEAVSIVDNLGEYFDYPYCPPLIDADPDAPDVNGLKANLIKLVCPRFVLVPWRIGD